MLVHSRRGPCYCGPMSQFRYPWNSFDSLCCPFVWLDMNNSEKGTFCTQVSVVLYVSLLIHCKTLINSCGVCTFSQIPNLTWTTSRVWHLCTHTHTHAHLLDAGGHPSQTPFHHGRSHNTRGGRYTGINANTGMALCHDMDLAVSWISWYMNKCIK